MTRQKELIAATAILLAVSTLIPAEAAVEVRDGRKLTAKMEKDKVVVTVGGKVFTCYKFGKSQKYPYFWPVNGPVSGKSVTTETSEPYPHHHPRFFGCDRVNGGHYWLDVVDRGQIISQTPKIVESGGEKVILTDECLWKQPGKEPIIKDNRRITISAPNKEMRTIDFDITIESLVDVTILKSNHALFSARVVPELSVKSGGTLVNAEGKRGEKGTWGINSPWCDYYGTRSGVTEGIAIFDNPNNRWFPCKWFTRDYGFFSPTPMNWLEGGKLELPKGKTLKLQYRVVVHTGDTAKARIEELFKLYKLGNEVIRGGTPRKTY